MYTRIYIKKMNTRKRKKIDRLGINSMYKIYLKMCISNFSNNRSHKIYKNRVNIYSDRWD